MEERIRIFEDLVQRIEKSFVCKYYWHRKSPFTTIAIYYHKTAPEFVYSYTCTKLVHVMVQYLQGLQF